MRDVLETVKFPLPTTHAEAGNDLLIDAIHQLDDYLIPRYRNMDAPILAVIGGSTGSGKSTLINSLVREHVAPASAVRPTTRQPMLMFNPADELWFDDDRILPELQRVHGTTVHKQAQKHISLHATETLASGLALIDSPDIDSVAKENRELAAQLLAAADLWVFVTTAARYADAIPWALLDEAAERNIVVAIVLNRVPRGQGAEVRPDLVRRLNSRGLGSAPLFVISEQEFDELGFIRDDDVASLRDWLTALTRDSAARSAVVRQTLSGAVANLTQSLSTIHDSYQEQIEAQESLQWDIDHACEEALGGIDRALRNGLLLRGEVLARWQDIVGTGTWTRVLEDGVSRFRDRVTNWFTGRTNDKEAVAAIEEGVQTLLISQSEAAILQISTAWQRAGLIDTPQISYTSEQRHEEAATIVRQWQEELYDLISAESSSKKTTARFLALGVNAVGVALMITVFSATAGLAGGEVAIAGGTAVVAQRVLEAVFGDDAVRRMTKQATASLHELAASFIEANIEEYRRALHELSLDPTIEHSLAQVTTELRHVHNKERTS
ncbi:GTPase domain-containing protein [Arcanobacterium phocae]|uniref:GTPase domain-containing protein n=1 Tax=Arcanobacterium phocae TaxID=131112 RepID=UPI0012F92645|nr:GTPase domain-containing protein [Arcanobacterium phocae]